MNSSDLRVAKFSGLLVLFLLYLSASTATVCYAQGKNPCAVITKAEAEAVVGTTLEGPQLIPGESLCKYLEPGYAVDPVNRKLVTIGLFHSESPDPEAVNERRQLLSQDRSLLPVISEEVPDFGDEAIWVWAGGYLGALYAFKGGRTEVTVKISGITEKAALQAAKMIAARALGGTGKSGYLYASPGTPMTK